MKLNTRIYFLLLFILSSNLAQANADDSTKLQELKFKLIKKAVCFYAIDTALNKGKQIPDLDAATNITELTNFSKGLTGVGDRIEEFNNTIVANKAGLKELEQVIIEKVNYKAYRTKSKAYPKFTEDMDVIVNLAPDEIISTNPTPPVTSSSTTNSAVIPLKEEGIVQPIESSLFSDLNLWNGIAISLSVIAIVLSIIFLRRKKKKYTSSPSFSNLQNNSVNNDFLFDQINGKIRALEVNFSDLKIELRKQQFIEEGEKNSENNVIITTQTAQGGTMIKYAKTADGNAFYVDALSDVQDNKKIYEITIEGSEKGTFKVTSNREAQLFALEDPNNYLRGACKYHSVPSHDSTIITDIPGKIELVGNKWTIIIPAQIDFS